MKAIWIGKTETGDSHEVLTQEVRFCCREIRRLDPAFRTDKELFLSVAGIVEGNQGGTNEC